MSEKRFETAVFWFRRDLRTIDNNGLLQACEQAKNVVPVFVHDQNHEQVLGRSPFRESFRFGCLEKLAQELENLGSMLVVRQGESIAEIISAVRKFHANAVFFNRAYEPGEIARDRRITDELNKMGINVLSFEDQLLFNPEEINNERPGGYLVYTPFRKALLTKTIDKPIRSPDKIHSPSIAANTNSYLEAIRPENWANPDLDPGSDAALRLLKNFVECKLGDYPTGRDQLGEDGTSRLSAYLNVGAISSRIIANAASDLPGADKWLSELFWREFYAYVLWNHPQAQNGPLRSQFNNIKWSDDEQDLKAWKDGKTGYPVVDAAMRQLRETGWMHNRARMIVASFLTKDLLINWQHGERHFMQLLTDGDLAQNNGGWQWSAGTGTDAQPYFRIFNPILQSKKFDHDAKYIKRWLPELADVPSELIHTPWLMTSLDQEYANCRIGLDYPGPIVDHASQRAVTLAAYKVNQNMG
jgi:deoxyribodipyrimidine photo-lyase